MEAQSECVNFPMQENLLTYKHTCQHVFYCTFILFITSGHLLSHEDINHQHKNSFYSCSTVTPLFRAKNNGARTPAPTRRLHSVPCVLAEGWAVETVHLMNINTFVIGTLSLR